MKKLAVLALIFACTSTFLTAHADPCVAVGNQIVTTFDAMTVSVGSWCPGDGSTGHYVHFDNKGTAGFHLDDYSNDSLKAITLYNSLNQTQISVSDLNACIVKIGLLKQLNQNQLALLPAIEEEFKGEVPPLTPDVLMRAQAAENYIVKLCLMAE